jgi:glutathione S-transferase
MKLYRLPYSPYARKVQLLLDLLGRRYNTVDVPYSDRSELATLTGGYIYVPVLVEDDGTVITDSRRICEHLLAGEAGARFVPPPFEGPVWGYADWCDGALEDVLFRIASPAIRDRWRSPSDRALYILIKERKFGAGCIDAWQNDREPLLARANALLAPTARTLAARHFLFGDTPTLADVSLYGEFAMLTYGDPQLVTRLPPEFGPWLRRLEELATPKR